MRWTVHGERPIYTSAWVSLSLVDVEIPGERRFDHHVVRVPAPAAGVAVVDPQKGVLLLWRHRFITDTWGWEVPAGRVDRGESLEEAAAREVLEETGWTCGPLTLLTTFHPTTGMSDTTFTAFRADGATFVGAPSDPSESERIEWVPMAVIADALRDGRILDGLSVVALLHLLAFP